MNSTNSLFNLDSSFNTTHAISDDEFRSVAYQKLQQVLVKEFPGDYERQKIKIAYDRWQFACPFCHDSAIVSSKKRGNFIFKEGPFKNSFKCFNCNTFKPIDKFFKEFNTDLPYTVIDYLITNKPSLGTFSPSSFAEYKDTVFNSSEMKEYGIKIEDFIRMFNLIPISKENKSIGYYYLCKRMQFDWSKFLYDPKNNSIIILNLIEDKVIAFQIRNLNQSYKGPKYITISLKMIHEKILKDKREIPQDLESLSMLFNLYQVNPSKPILVTEGPMDAFLLPNCIASLGANKKINIGLPLWYVYDSDKAGREHAIDMLKKSQHVFLWEKLANDYLLPQRKKWDINDFVVWCHNNNKMIPKYWQPYFSNDPLDMLDI